MSLATVAASTYAQYLWCDLSVLFNCPVGVDRVAIHRAYGDREQIDLMFHWMEDPDMSWQTITGGHNPFIVRLPITAEIEKLWADAIKAATAYEAKFKGKKTDRPVSSEADRRITLAVAAYAYEMEGDTLMDDHAFDALCLQVDPTVDTGDPELDAFWLTEFHPSTGMWIHSYPQLPKIEEQYANVKRLQYETD